MMSDISYKTMEYCAVAACIGLGVHNAMHGHFEFTALDTGLAIINYKAANL